MYLSGRKAITEDDGKWLDKAKITHVVSLTQLIPPQMKDRKHIRHLKVRINDSENAKLELARKLPEILSFIEKARREDGKVLVHCDAGMSRSASVVLAYCMRFGKMTLIQAIKLVRKRRTMISPNPAFMALLCDLERSLFGMLLWILISTARSGSAVTRYTWLRNRQRRKLLNNNDAVQYLIIIYLLNPTTKLAQRSLCLLQWSYLPRTETSRRNKC